MELKKLDGDFTVCKVQKISGIDFNNDFTFLSKTDEEISLVCESRFVPKDIIAAEPGWKALKIVGILDFAMIGVISKITNILSQANISVFIISTYNTDYIFLKQFDYEKGIALLEDCGYMIK